jgi:hypothetical protein
MPSTIVLQLQRRLIWIKPHGCRSQALLIDHDGNLAGPVPLCRWAWQE